MNHLWALSMGAERVRRRGEKLHLRIALANFLQPGAEIG